MNSDFRGFMSGEPIEPPKALSDQILTRIRDELNPNPWKIFAKLAGIHFVVALVTLSLCPQFGIRLWGEGMGLMHYFMTMGDYGCMAACGTFFLGSSLLIAAMILRPEEVRVVRKNRFFELAGLVMLSFGFFVMANAEIVLGFALAWVLGSLLGGMLTLEVAWSLRLRSLSSA